MKYISIAFVSGILLTAIIFNAILTISQKKISDQTGFNYRLSEDIFQNVNEYRKSMDYEPLIQNDAVCDLSKVRSMEISKDFSHQGFRDRVSDINYKMVLHYSNLGENLSWDILSGQEVLFAWLMSPKHKEILDTPYKYGCVSCYNKYCALNLLNQ